MLVSTVVAGLQIMFPCVLTRSLIMRNPNISLQLWWTWNIMSAVTLYLWYCSERTSLPKLLTTFWDSFGWCLSCLRCLLHSLLDFLANFCTADLFQPLLKHKKTQVTPSAGGCILFNNIAMIQQSKERLSTYDIHLFNRLWDVPQLLLENLRRLHCFRLNRFLEKGRWEIVIKCVGFLKHIFYKGRRTQMLHASHNTNIFPSSLCQCVRLLQFFGLFPELLDVFFHFLVLV